jgi:hypothetical protein
MRVLPKRLAKSVQGRETWQSGKPEGQRIRRKVQEVGTLFSREQSRS